VENAKKFKLWSLWNSTGLVMEGLCSDWSQIFSSFLQAREVLTKEAIHGSFKVCHEVFASYYRLQWKRALLRAVNHVLHHFGSHLCHGEPKKWRCTWNKRRVTKFEPRTQSNKEERQNKSTGHWKTTSNHRTEVCPTNLGKSGIIEKQNTRRVYFEWQSTTCRND